MLRVLKSVRWSISAIGILGDDFSHIVGMSRSCFLYIEQNVSAIPQPSARLDRQANKIRSEALDYLWIGMVRNARRASAPRFPADYEERDPLRTV